jgi:steroid delta-isomerase-like uncharacterized protein
MQMNGKRMLAGAIGFALLAMAVVAAPAHGKSEADSGAVIAEKFAAGWNSHSPDKMVPLFTDDAVYEDVAYGEVNHGSAELHKFFVEELEGVPDLELKVVRANINIKDGHGTIEWTFSGTDKGIYKTGKKFSVRGVSVIDVRDGKISRSLDFYDSAGIMRQVGVLPKDPADTK